jgi:hypothetical protein
LKFASRDTRPAFARKNEKLNTESPRPRLGRKFLGEGVKILGAFRPGTAWLQRTHFRQNSRNFFCSWSTLKIAAACLAQTVQTTPKYWRIEQMAGAMQLGRFGLDKRMFALAIVAQATFVLTY